jgi:hypothetical protein
MQFTALSIGAPATGVQTPASEDVSGRLAGACSQNGRRAGLTARSIFWSVWNWLTA